MKLPTKTLHIFLGPSGSGKDFLRKAMGEPLLFIHPIGPYKRFLESEVWGLEPGFLDDAESKQKTIPGSDTTYQEYLVKQYHTHRDMGVSISEAMLQTQLMDFVDDPNDTYLEAAITGIRTLGEAKVVAEVAKRYQHKLRVWVYALCGRGRLETSDLELWNVAAYLMSHSNTVASFIDNSKDKTA